MQWSEPTSVDEAVDAAEAGLVASPRVRVEAHGERLSRRVELFARQRRDVAAQLVAVWPRRTQVVIRVRVRVHVQVEAQVVRAPAARHAAQAYLLTYISSVIGAFLSPI